MNIEDDPIITKLYIDWDWCWAIVSEKKSEHDKISLVDGKSFKHDGSFVCIPSLVSGLNIISSHRILTLESDNGALDLHAFSVIFDADVINMKKPLKFDIEDYCSFKEKFDRLMDDLVKSQSL